MQNNNAYKNNQTSYPNQISTRSSFLNITCVECGKAHFSFGCPPPPPEKTNNSPKIDEKTNSAGTNGGNMVGETNRWMDRQGEVRFVRGGRNVGQRVAHASLVNNRPIQHRPPPPTAQFPVHVRMPVRPLMQPPNPHRNFSTHPCPRRENGERSKSSRRLTNPGAYCGGRSIGQEIRNGTIPSMRQMEEVIEAVRPIVYGTEEMYEEHPLPIPNAPSRSVDPAVQENSRMPRIPSDKMYSFETVTLYDLNGNVISEKETTREIHVGGPNDAVVLIFGNDFVS